MPAVYTEYRLESHQDWVLHLDWAVWSGESGTLALIKVVLLAGGGVQQAVHIATWLVLQMATTICNTLS